MTQWDGKERRREVNSLVTMLARIEERQISHFDKMDKHIEMDEKKFEQIEKEIGVLSRNMWLAVGGGTVIMWVITAVVK